jgi:isoamylase
VTLRPGLPHPLGAHWDGEGVNFAVFSAHATAIELCTFDAEGRETRHRLPAHSGDVFHGYLQGAGPGLRYGLRAHGPWRPEEWLRFDPSKLLVDPYARALEGVVRWHESLLAKPGGATPTEDTAAHVPRCLVVDTAFDWQGDRPPRTPWSRTLLYECHVKGMTRLHPDVPEAQRGRYAGLAAPAVVDHLRSLGVTAVSLLPVHAHGVDPHLGRVGLPNYWGYATLGFFAPDARFASGDDGVQVREFKEMVRALHAAGLEVILDVVYNHTPEGNEHGATLSLRGLDERSYYRGDPERPGHCEDFTGCGNTLDTRQPRTLQLVLDSLRYWVGEMHVDGFRFDLAPALAREEGGAMRGHGRFLEALRHDPLLGGVKLIVEPWDLAPHGDCSGAFPFGIAEWNGRYRDAVRRFWRGDDHGVAGQLAARISGSQDLYGWNGRPPQASINFVTAHDGMTLLDLVSYARRHNEANLEGNRDGHAHEVTFETGVEGPTSDPRVRARRDRARRALVATLACSQGVPMLSHGDELSRTQRGNNNAYCHDSELTWLDWSMDPERQAFLDFVRRAFRVRRENPVFRRRSFFRGAPVEPGGARDVNWLHPDGRPLVDDDWQEIGQLAVWIPGEAADASDERGEPQRGRSVLMLFNASASEVRFRLPKPGSPGRWEPCLDTGDPPSQPEVDACRVGAGTFVLLTWSAP